MFLTRLRSYGGWLGEDSLVKKLQIFAGSDTLFVAIIILFALQALWVALSINISGLYDEQFHFGVSEIYSRYINPFSIKQDPSWDIWGDVTRNTSYLYYYFNGKVINILDILGAGVVFKILVLRIISIAFFATGLVFFKRTLVRLGFNGKLINFSLLFFVLIPAVPIIAGQINYDNPVFALTGLFLLISIKLIQSPKMDISSFALLIFVGTIGSLIKFSFLPLFAFGLLGLLFIYAIKYKRNFFKKLKFSWVRLDLILKIITAFLLVFSVLLFIERYGFNQYQYGKLNPDCQKVMSIDRCKQYVTWNRNYEWKTSMTKKADYDPFIHLGKWTSGMVNTKFNFAFMLDINDKRQVIAAFKKPLPIPYRTYQVLVVIGLVVILIDSRSFKSKERKWAIFVSVAFVLALIIYNILDYLEYGVVAATNGRYLFPVLPLLIAFAAYSLSMVTMKYKNVPMIIGIVTLLMFTQGGGVMSTILQVEKEWLWRNDSVIEVHSELQRLLKPVVKEN